MIDLASNTGRDAAAGPYRTPIRRSALWAGLGLLALALTLMPLKWAAGLLVASAFAVGTLVYPAAALVGLALAIPFGSLAPLPLPGVNLVDALVALGVAVWLAQGCAARRIMLTPPRLTWPLLIFLGLAGTSLTGATDWREGLPELLKWVEFAAVYVLAAQVLTPAARPWTVAALLVAGGVQVGIGAYQFLGQAGPEPFIILGRFLRAYGTFRQPNPYAGYLGYLYPVALSLLLGAWAGWRRQRGKRAFGLTLAAAGAAAALAAGIGMSWSRGAWLGLAAATVTVAGLRDRRAMAWAALAAVLLALAGGLFGFGWLPDAVTDRLGGLGGFVSASDPARIEITDANFSVLERMAHWRAGLAMFSDHPWLGVGIGNFAARYGEYAPPHWYDPLGHAHNVFINFLAETGALGGGAFMVFWVGLAWFTAQKAARRRGLEAALALGLLGTWVYLTVHSMFDNLFVQHSQLQLALLLGVVVTGEDAPRAAGDRP